MLPKIGKNIVVTSEEQANAIHTAVANGKSLDTSKFNWVPVKTVQEVLSENHPPH